MEDVYIDLTKDSKSVIFKGLLTYFAVTCKFIFRLKCCVFWGIRVIHSLVLCTLWNKEL